GAAPRLAVMRLELEVALARMVGRLSRLARAGGGTTLPGKLLAAVDPEAMGALAARLPRGCALVSATNGKTTTCALAASILGRRVRLARNGAGANLVSGIASTLLGARGAELGLFETDEAAVAEVARRVRPRAVCLANLFRDQLDRYGELELVAERWRAMVAELPEEAVLLVNGDDPVVADLARAHACSVVFGVDDPRHARADLQHAADSKYCLRCGTPYDYAAAYVGHLGDYRCRACGHARPRLDVAARGVVLAGTEGGAFDLETPRGTRRVALRLPGLDDVVAGLEQASPAFGRFERILLGERRLLVLLIKNPAGANEALRTVVSDEGPRLAVVALNDAIADGRDVSWIWDVDFELLGQGLDKLIATGERAAELALRFKYGGLPASAIEVVPDLEAALDRGLELTPAGGELVFLPTYTAMLALQEIVTRRGHARPYWERAA